MAVGRGVRYEADSLMSAAEDRILRHEAAVSNREPPWDGFCGLVQVRDDEPAALSTGPRRQPVPPQGAPAHLRFNSAGTAPTQKPKLQPWQYLGTAEAGLQVNLQSAPQPSDSLCQDAIGEKSSEEADRHFRSAVNLIKGSQFASALVQLQQAQASCPDNQQHALLRIHRFMDAVQKALA